MADDDISDMTIVEAKRELFHLRKEHRSAVALGTELHEALRNLVDNVRVHGGVHVPSKVRDALSKKVPDHPDTKALVDMEAELRNEQHALDLHKKAIKKLAEAWLASVPDASKPIVKKSIEELVGAERM